MTRKGNYWDNSVAESFFSSLKKERIKKQIYKNPELALAEVADYIDTFYNRTRRHSHLGGVSPEEFEAAHKPRRKGVKLNPGNSTLQVDLVSRALYLAFTGALPDSACIMRVFFNSPPVGAGDASYSSPRGELDTGSGLLVVSNHLPWRLIATPSTRPQAIGGTSLRSLPEPASKSQSLIVSAVRRRRFGPKPTCRR
jgi:Integrase core domain